MNKILLLITVLLVGCVAEREYVVDYDYSYRGNFRKYKTFCFLDTKDTVNYNGMSDLLIREEIMKRLSSQGYEFDEQKPSILVAYKIFDADFELQGYEQLTLETWDSHFGQFEPNDQDLASIKEAQYNERQVALRKGTLLIDFIDRKTHSVIWQGYASGLFDDATMFSKDAKYAVRTILNQYRLLAYGQIQK
jgi:hypothetical protein